VLDFSWAFYLYYPYLALSDNSLAFIASDSMEPFQELKDGFGDALGNKFVISISFVSMVFSWLLFSFFLGPMHC
jgi:hypothetical protein